MPGSEVRIRVLFDSAVAKAAVADFARQSTTANKAIAAEARVASTATLGLAHAVQTVERAAVSASRAQLLHAQASANVAKASRITAESLGAEAAAAAKATAAFERKTAVQARAADRALVSADNRINRDMSWLARDEKDVGSRRRQIAGQAAGAATTGGAAVLVGLGATFGPMSNFDQDLRNVNSLAKVSEAEFKKLHDSVLDISKDPLVRQMPADLAKGLYDIVSSGYSGKQALDLLRVSAVGAGAGMTDTLTATKVMTSVLQSGIGGVTSASQAMDVLFQEVNFGKNTFEELASQIGPVLPLAAKMGVTLPEVSAALATMTLQGISAGEASTELNQLLIQLNTNSPQAAKEMDKLGIVHGMAAVRAEGLTGALKNVIEKTRGHDDALRHVFPRLESFIGYLALSKNNGQDYTAMLDHMAHATDGLGATQAAAQEQAKGAAFQADKVKQEYERLAISVGEKLLPTFRELGREATAVAEAFNKLTPEQQQAIVHALAFTAALALGVGLLTKTAFGIRDLMEALSLAKIWFGALGAAEGEAGAAGLLAFGPGAAVVVGIAALGVELIALKNDWDDVKRSEDQAANSAMAYADKLKALKAGTNRDALIATKNDLGRESGDLKSAMLVAGQIKPLPGQNAQDMKIVRDASLRSQLGDSGYDTANNSYRTMAGAQARLNALLPDLAKVTNALHAQTPSANAANRMADTHADQLAPYQVPLLKAVGQFHDASVQCGEFIRKGASAFGMVGNIQSAANAALKGKNVVKSDGVDSHGAPRYPNGTVIYFGHHGAQHFVSTYVNDRGEQKVVENTEAGQGKGRWRVRADRDLSRIAAEFHGHQVAFHLPGVTGPTAAQGGLPPTKYNGGTFGDAGPDKSAAAALVEKAGLAADDAKRAYEQATKAFEDTKSVHYLAAAESLRHTQATREIEEARANRAKADAVKDPETAPNGVAFERKRRDILASAAKDIKALEEQAGGTAEDHRKAAADLAVNVLNGRLESANQAVSRLEALAAVSTDPKNADALLAAYKTQAQAQMELLRATLKHTLADIPNTPGRQTQRQALVSGEQTQELRVMGDLATKTAEVDTRRIEASQRLLTLQREQAAASQAEQDALLAAAQIEAERQPLREEIHQAKLKELNATRRMALLDSDAKYRPLLDRATPDTRPGLETQSNAAARRINENYGTAVGAENIAFGTQEREAANAAISTRADRLRTEAGLTDDLTAKMAKLAQAYDLMIGVEPDPAAAGLMRQQKQDEQDKLGLRRDADAAQRSLAGGMVANDPAAITAALDALKALTTDARANREEQASARGEYGTAIRDLTEQLRLSPREAVSRINDERPNMTAGELASATAAAKSILDGMLDRSFTSIDTLHDPRDRKRALDGLKKSVDADPVYRAAGVTGDADKKITERIASTLKRSGIVDEFMGELSAGAGRASSGVVHALLNPKDRKNIGKAFWADIASAAEGALGNVVQKEVTHGLEGLLGAGTDALGNIVGGHKKRTPGSLADPSQAKSDPKSAGGASATGGALGSITGILGPLLGDKGRTGDARVVDTMHVANLVVAGTTGKPGVKPGGVAGADSGVAGDIGTGLGIASLLAGPLFGAGAGAAVSGISSIFGSIGSLFHFAEGGIVPGPAGAGDVIHALLSPGEAVIPAARVRAFRDAAPTARAFRLPEGSDQGTQAQAQTVNYEAHYHQPVFHNAEDIDRENRRNAQRLRTAFTVG